MSRRSPSGSSTDSSTLTRVSLWSPTFDGTPLGRRRRLPPFAPTYQFFVSRLLSSPRQWETYDCRVPDPETGDVRSWGLSGRSGSLCSSPDGGPGPTTLSWAHSRTPKLDTRTPVGPGGRDGTVVRRTRRTLDSVKVNTRWVVREGRGSGYSEVHDPRKHSSLPKEMGEVGTDLLEGLRLGYTSWGLTPFLRNIWSVLRPP